MKVLTNCVPVEGGYEVHVELEDVYITQDHMLKEAVNQSLSGKCLHVCMTRHGNVLHFQSSSLTPWKKDTAIFVQGVVSGTLPSFQNGVLFQKYQRQVRDAFNKCKDPEVLEKIGEILRVKKFILVGVEQAE